MTANNLTAVKDRHLFFDTNVLLYLFGGGYAQPKIVNAYTKIFRQCLTMKNTLCVDTLVLSEFINRCLRMEYDAYLQAKGINKGVMSFKKFRSTPEGVGFSEGIELTVKDTILRHFTMVGKDFNHSDICSINLANADFNDELIIQICQEHKCVLVTHDADFSGANIDILTANDKLH